MSMRLPLLIGALTLAVPAWAGAQDSQIITFADAVEMALERNTALRQTQIDAAISDVAVSEARMRFAPDMKVDTNTRRNYGRSVYEAEGRVLRQTTDTASLDVSSGVSLFNGFRDVSELRQAKAARAARWYDAARAEQSTVFDLASRFLALFESRELLRVLRENLAAEANLEQQINGYVQSGLQAVATLYQQRANLAAARLAVVQAQTVMQSDEVELMRLLQLDAAGVYDFQFVAEAADEPVLPGMAELIEGALAHRADLRAEESRVAAAEHSLGVAESGFWPTLTLSASYGSGYSSASDVSFRDQLESERGGVVGLHFSVPLFDRAETLNAARRARLAILRARVELDAARKEIGLQIRQVYQDYRGARERFSVAEAQKQEAERAVDTAEQRFKTGVTSLVEVTQARAGHVQAARALVTARANMLLQRTALDYYRGIFGEDGLLKR